MTLNVVDGNFGNSNLSKSKMLVNVAFFATSLSVN